jgi:WD40 repeat protein
VIASGATVTLTSYESWNLARTGACRCSRTRATHTATRQDRSATRRARKTRSAILATDGHTYGIGGGVGHIYLWDGHRSDPATLLGGNTDATARYAGPPKFAFSADGRILAVGLPFRLWDVASRKALGPPLSGGAISALAFSPDGRTLAATDGEEVQLWDILASSDLADLRAQVCGLVLGDLTRAEWTSIAPGIAYRRSCSR